MENDNYFEKSPYARRKSLSQDIANNLITFIQENNYQPGDRIPSEYELSDKFDVGRSTIREAVKILASRNILEIRPARGTYVSDKPGLTEDPLGLDFIQDKRKLVNDLLELRIIVEEYAVRNAALRATPEQIKKMREFADAIQTHHDENDICMQNDIALHQCIAESCGNAVISLVLPIIRKGKVMFNELNFERQWDIVNAGHYAIIEAIEQHNPMRAEIALIRHLGYVFDKMHDIDQSEEDRSAQ